MIHPLAGVLLGVGFLFVAVSVVGILRLPDFYTRLHAMGKSDALGVSLMAAGMAVETGVSLSAVKILLIAAFTALSSVLTAHALGRAAYRSGLVPWDREEGQ